jgi:hypothetical protein
MVGQNRGWQEAFYLIKGHERLGLVGTAAKGVFLGIGAG